MRVLYRRMFGSRLFRSRWAALFWACGICWTAISVAPDDPPDAPQTNTTISETDQAAQMQHLQQLVGKLEQQ